MSLGYTVQNRQMVSARCRPPRGDHCASATQQGREGALLAPRTKWHAVGVTSFALSGALLLVSALRYKQQNPTVLPLLTLISVSLAFISWLRHMLAMNLLVKRETRTPARWLALYYFGCYSVSLLAASLFATLSSPVEQLLSSLVASSFTWVGFVLIFEGDLVYPSRQQYAALSQLILLHVVYEVRVFVITLHFE